MLYFPDSLRMKRLYEVDFPIDSEEQGTDQYDSADSSDVFIGSAAEGDFVRLQRDFHQKY